MTIEELNELEFALTYNYVNCHERIINLGLKLIREQKKIQGCDHDFSVKYCDGRIDKLVCYKCGHETQRNCPLDAD
jgi:hypothetical protein